MSSQDDNRSSGKLTDENMVFGFESAGLLGKGTHAPFWHTSNRQGLSSIEKESGLMHFAVLGNMSLLNGMEVDYGLDFGAEASSKSNMFLHQLYVDLRYKRIGLDVGK